MNKKNLQVGLPFAKETEHEILRLHQHPSLFSSENERRSFWQSVVSEDLGAVAGIFSKREGLFIGREHDRAMDDELEAETWDRNGAREPHLDPWAQFLCNRAPGSGIDFSAHPGGCVQLLPFAGCRIMKSLKDEDKANADRIKLVRSLASSKCDH